jgi:hypothetical protein
MVDIWYVNCLVAIIHTECYVSGFVSAMRIETLAGLLAVIYLIFMCKMAGYYSSTSHFNVRCGSFHRICEYTEICLHSSFGLRCLEF